MSVLVSFALFYIATDTLVWDLPGYVLAAPVSALWRWKGVILSLFLTPMVTQHSPCAWRMHELCDAHMWSHHLISQAGWNRCKLILLNSVTLIAVRRCSSVEYLTFVAKVLFCFLG